MMGRGYVPPPFSRNAPKELMVTENGYSRQEVPDRHGRIMDYDRIAYLYRR